MSARKNVPGPESRHLVFIGPSSRALFRPDVRLTRQKGLVDQACVTIEVLTHYVEIVAPLVDRQILRPIILDPVQFEPATGGEPADLVRAARQRRIERGFCEVPLSE